MRANFDKRLVIGRRITDVLVSSFQSRPNTAPRERAHNVEIVLDNGAAIVFTVEETDVGEYGICPGLRKATRRNETTAKAATSRRRAQ